MKHGVVVIIIRIYTCSFTYIMVQPPDTLAQVSSCSDNNNRLLIISKINNNIHHFISICMHKWIHTSETQYQIRVSLSLSFKSHETTDCLERFTASSCIPSHVLYIYVQHKLNTILEWKRIYRTKLDTYIITVQFLLHCLKEHQFSSHFTNA